MDESPDPRLKEQGQSVSEHTSHCGDGSHTWCKQCAKISDSECSRRGYSQLFFCLKQRDANFAKSFTLLC